MKYQLILVIVLLILLGRLFSLCVSLLKVLFLSLTKIEYFIWITINPNSNAAADAGGGAGACARLPVLSGGCAGAVRGERLMLVLEADKAAGCGRTSIFCLDGRSPADSAGSTGFVGCDQDNAYICVTQVVVKSAGNETRSILSFHSGKQLPSQDTLINLILGISWVCLLYNLD